MNNSATEFAADSKAWNPRIPTARFVADCDTWIRTFPETEVEVKREEEEAEILCDNKILGRLRKYIIAEGTGKMLFGDVVEVTLLGSFACGYPSQKALMNLLVALYVIVKAVRVIPKYLLEGNKLCMQSCSGDTLEEGDGKYLVIDVGANLTSKKFHRDLDGVIQRAREAGVQKLISTGTSIQSSREGIRLSRLYPQCVYATAGVHPHDAKAWDASSLQELRELAALPECVAIGECGLDFNRNFSPRDVQLDVFKKQVTLAVELQKPLFLHERDANREMLEILSSHRSQLPPTVIHCFTGTREMALQYLELGLYLGLTGYLWKDKSSNGVRSLLTEQLIPLDKLLLETDAPFMFPNFRGAKLPPDVRSALTPSSTVPLDRYCSFSRNEPCSLPLILELVAAFMKKPPHEVALATTFNAIKVFGLRSG
ncbi:unnamed protein product [Cyprideis torosa]|uniref:Deoxyribonuclease TATDN1 n=1 Tax=Cyprideis torosa TaxID=163714 RepID=A0A7R8WL55_9CRUS|nr:unnamed protein product [Cyprideis torosa]CAG0901222.1 unnamed protein product [Cyprideis torosa]